MIPLEKKDMLAALAQLVKNHSSDLHARLLMHAGADNGTTTAAELPDLDQEAQAALDNVLQALDHIQFSSESLVEDLLGCYDQLNIAFKAVDAVAECNTAPEAVRELARQIGKAIDARYMYYEGPYAVQFTLTQERDDHAERLMIITEQEEQFAAAESFFHRNEQDMQGLLSEESLPQVRMIDFHGPDDPDYVGRGNVLCLRLRAHDADLQNMGVLGFVRVDDQVPFVAVEKNLADTLGRMGSAVLGNIIYTEKLHKTYLQTIASLVNAMEAKDSYTCGHSNRVAQLARALGKEMGLDDRELQLLEWAGVMHDIGKIGIRDDVLGKPGKLTDEEYDHIKTHPLKSYTVLEPIEALHRILAAVRHHHEHYDGTGYPDGLSGVAIPLHARVIQVADIWDALTSTRSYRKAMPTEKALRIMKEEAGTTMDPEIVACFFQVLEKEPQIRKLCMLTEE